MTILELSNSCARRYFMEPQHYVSTDLPPYFDFKVALDFAEDALRSSRLAKNLISEAKKVNGVNYTLINNKDGRYAWRPIQFIHPILYVDLVQNMTTRQNWQMLQRRFLEFGRLNRIIEAAKKYSDFSAEI